MYIPLHINIHGKKVLIVGLGKIGKRRAEKLLKYGADVAAIEQKKIQVKKIKLFKKKLKCNTIPSLRGYFLVVTSTNDQKLNEAIARRAKRDGCLINRADLFSDGDVVFSAVVETRAGIISFTTLGKNPKLSKWTKEVLERELPVC